MSRGPSRLETKWSQRPSGDHAGAWFTVRLSVARVTRPSDMRQITVALGDMLPKISPTVMDSTFPLVHAIIVPSGDQVHALGSNTSATARLVPSSPRRKIESPTA